MEAGDTQLQNYDLFISHSSLDKDAVRDVVSTLRHHGLKVWFDEWEIKVGDRIFQKVSDGLLRSRFLALWLTKASVESGWVEREWQSAYNQEVNDDKVRILPLLAEDCDIPPLLRDKRYADFRTTYEHGFEQLFSVVRPNYHYSFERLIDEEIEFMKGYPLSLLKGCHYSELERMFTDHLTLQPETREEIAFRSAFPRFLEWLRDQPEGKDA